MCCSIFLRGIAHIGHTFIMYALLSANSCSSSVLQGNTLISNCNKNEGTKVHNPRRYILLCIVIMLYV